jgi:hypothetical protein
MIRKIERRVFLVAFIIVLLGSHCGINGTALALTGDRK